MKRSSTRHFAFIVTVSILAALATVFVSTARADWNPGDPAKWVQLPDLQNGMDVLDTFSPLLPYNKILADDFLCTQTGPITDIHIWGSWLNDRVPRDPLGNVIPPLFDLSFHTDVPAGVDTPWSHPGPQVWDQVLRPSQSRIYATSFERFYDPNINQVIGTDTQVWQYNFDIPEALSFHQDQGNIYWLNVQVQPQPFEDQFGPYVFGWKTSIDHFNDDAVFGDNFLLSQPPSFWQELRDPLTHQSLDLAFALTTIPEPSSCLFGVIVSGLLLVISCAPRRNYGQGRDQHAAVG